MTTSIQSIDANTSSVQVNSVEALRLVPGGVQVASVNGGPISGFRNRIINGDMRIDQRNNGAAITPTVSGVGTLDRWVLGAAQPSKLTVQRNAGAVTPPPGFSNYLGVTTAAAYTAAAAENFMLYQGIEGVNISDFAWGTANAKSVMLGFFVYSSLTGTFSGALSNNSRSYPFTFTINAANTWTYVTVPIPGDTGGPWSTDSSVGTYVLFDLGSGSSKRGPAGAWAAATSYGATGSVSVIGTAGATFYVTGVQLEPGSIATQFERRPYALEFAMCQRYLCVTNPLTPKGNVVGSIALMAMTANTLAGAYRYPVAMRIAPTMQLWNNGVQNQVRNTSTGAAVPGFGAPSFNTPTAFGFLLMNGAGLTAGTFFDFDLICDAEL